MKWFRIRIFRRHSPNKEGKNGFGQKFKTEHRLDDLPCARHSTVYMYTSKEERGKEYSYNDVSPLDIMFETHAAGH